MTDWKPTRRWYHLTPDRFFIGLLAVQVFLFLSDQSKWLPFNVKKGWTVLIAVAVVGLSVLLMLFWGLVWLLLRRPFQFGVRSLLVFLAAVSVPLGWFAWEMQRANRQRAAVEAILPRGGNVHYDYEYSADGTRLDVAGPAVPAWLRASVGDDFFCDVIEVSVQAHVAIPKFTDAHVVHLQQLVYLRFLYLRDTRLSDEGLARLQELVRLESLGLSGTQVSDVGLEHVRQFKDLQYLDLNDTGVTDAALKDLSQLENLRYLGLDDTRVTDVGLQRLSGFAELTSLTLRNTRITDDGLAYLGEMAKLQLLMLDGTPITDNGLVYLRALTELETLWLTGTQVTSEGVQKLQQTLPNCSIVWR
jgi:hypothetical protein